MKQFALSSPRAGVIRVPNALQIMSDDDSDNEKPNK